MKLVELRLKLIYIGKNERQCASVLHCSFPSGRCKTLPFADHRPSLSLKPWKARVVKKAICTHRKLARAPTHVSVRARLVSRLLACWMLRGTRTPLQVKLFPVSQAASLIPEGFVTLSLSLFPPQLSPS